MNIVIQIVCLLALVFAIFAWYLSLMEFLVNLYIHRDNQLRGKKDEESDFVNTREMIKEDIVNFFNKIPENSPASVGSGMNPVFLYVKSFFSEISHIYRRKIFMRKEKRADATKSI